MSDIPDKTSNDTPANQNLSFAQFMRDPRKERAAAVLATTLRNLEDRENMPPHLLAEVLFELCFIEMTPDTPISDQDGIKWVSQLERFKAKLDEQLVAIDAACA